MTNINSFLKNIRSKTGSTSIKESRYGEVSTWISTGSLALNRIISGSIKKGIPSGRITILAGESSCSPATEIILVKNINGKEIFNARIGDFKLKSFREKYLVYTPDGWQRCTDFVEKGPLHCYRIKTNHKTCIAADKHLFQLANKEWITCDLLKIGDKLLSYDNKFKKSIEVVKSITDEGTINCFDITINHPNHRYYLDGISSHNTGKSLLAGLIMSNAIKQGFDHIFYFDSQGGGSNEFFENIGCDSSKIEQILVSSVEDAQLKILEVYNGIKELYDSTKEDEEKPKFLCVLDSLGALVAEKLLQDAEKGKVAAEMGNRAKKINNLVKALTIPALQTDTAMICINHIYDDPSAMFASKIKQQGGGHGISYQCSVNLQCTKLLEKDEQKDSEQFYSGTHLKFFTVKNRFARPGLECEVYLDFKKGFTRPFEALWDEAIRGGFILNPKQGFYTVPSCKEPEKLWRQSQLINNVEVWKTFLPKFEEWSKEDLMYHKLDSDADSALEDTVIQDEIQKEKKE